MPVPLEADAPSLQAAHRRRPPQPLGAPAQPHSALPTHRAPGAPRPWARRRAGAGCSYALASAGAFFGRPRVAFSFGAGLVPLPPMRSISYSKRPQPAVRHCPKPA